MCKIDFGSIFLARNHEHNKTGDNLFSSTSLAHFVGTFCAMTSY